jgi:hypothetical protein
LFEKPDELKHFALIQLIQSQHRLPVVDGTVVQAWDQEGTQPPFYHLVAALLTTWLDLEDFVEPVRNPHYADDRSFVWRERGNNNLYLHPPAENWRREPVLLAARLARWLSLLAGAGTILLTYGLARLVFGGEQADRWPSFASEPEKPGFTNNELFATQAALLAAALVAFLPQFLHVSSAISNDGLSVTLAAAALVLLASILRDGSSKRSALGLGLILGMGAITKLSLLYLLPLTGLVLVVEAIRRPAWPALAGQGLILGGLVGGLAGWWYGRNWLVYGDVTALNAHLLYRGGALEPRPTLAHLWQTELVGLELSFWAAYGAGQILLEPWLYDLLGWIKYIIFAGLGLGVWRALRPGRRGLANLATWPMLLLLGLWSVTIFIALLRWMQITPASWGRLLFPTLPALAVLTVWGLAQFSRLPFWRTPDRPLFPPLLGPALLLLFLFGLALISPFRYLAAAYGKPPLIPEAALARVDFSPLDLTYAGGLRLLGYRVEKPAIRAGEWLPVTLYWQASRPIAENYSSFVHLLDQEGQAIGQANTYPAGGHWPTSMLPPGQVLAATYHIFVPPAAETKAPLLTRLAFGIFTFDDPARAAKVALNRQGEVVEPVVSGLPLLPHHWPELNPQIPYSADFAGQIRLIGYDWVNQSWEAGTQPALTLYWQTLAPPGRDLTLFIHLVDPRTKRQITGFDGPPSFPTSLWQAGNTFIEPRRLALPADLAPGDYQLIIGWYEPATLARLSTTDGDMLPLLTVTVTP